MKKQLLVFFIFLVNVVFGQIPTETENVSVFGINKLPARTTAWPSSNLINAEKSDYDNNEWLTSLNGSWDFYWSPEPQKRPIEFYKPGFDISGWKTISVPSTMERQGYGTAIYTNSNYPFAVNPPYVMGVPDKNFTTFKERNPVGSYRKTFSVPQNWTN